MLEITENDESYREAYTLVEYMKLINGAIEMIKTYPGNGDEFYHVIKLAVQADAESRSDRWAAHMLQVPPCIYSRKKRKAMAVLSTILWGCNCDIFLQWLTE